MVSPLGLKLKLQAKIWKRPEGRFSVLVFLASGFTFRRFERPAVMFFFVFIRVYSWAVLSWAVFFNDFFTGTFYKMNQ
ncbi:hypothetical protein BMS3Abin05_02264 [bacterium BMS3Abin05]|nr:hypothetical protein BMS3Abin05_02264 [bacterium BMS3Abin05]